MKNKLLIAAIACLALSACQQSTTVEKDKDKDGADKTTVIDKTTVVEPSKTNPPGPQSLNEQEFNSNLAAEDQQAPINTAALDQPAATTTTTSTTTTTQIKCAEGDKKCEEDQRAALDKQATEVTSTTTSSTAQTVTSPDMNQPAAQ